jgi:hypothetical protein
MILSLERKVLTLMLTKYSTIKQFKEIWKKFEKTLIFLFIAAPVSTLHFISLIREDDGSRVQVEVLRYLCSEGVKTRFFEQIQCNSIGFDCQLTMPIEGWSGISGFAMCLGRLTSLIILRHPEVQVLELYNSVSWIFTLEEIKLFNTYKLEEIRLYNVPLDNFSHKPLTITFNDSEVITIYALWKHRSQRRADEIHIKLEELEKRRSQEKNKEEEWYCCLGKECDV